MTCRRWSPMAWDYPPVFSSGVGGCGGGESEEGKGEERRGFFFTRPRWEGLQGFLPGLALADRGVPLPQIMEDVEVNQLVRVVEQIVVCQRHRSWTSWRSFSLCAMSRSRLWHRATDHGGNHGGDSAGVKAIMMGIFAVFSWA